MISQKKHSSVKYTVMDIKAPGYGGLNIQDLPYDLTTSQSPKMMNMMLRHGAFSKRYGQKVFHEFSGNIIAIGKYKGDLYLHIGTTIQKYDVSANTVTEVYSNADLTTAKGVFINFNRMLYYLNGVQYIVFDGVGDNPMFNAVDPYTPDICINRTPDGASSDLIEDYNRLGSGFKNSFNADGSAKEYHLTDTNLDSTLVKATVGTSEMTEGTGFTVNRTTGVVTFTAAPVKGQNNVVITAYKTESEYISSIINNKYWTAFGGQNNSRLFLAGNGNSTYYYSDVFDASYFPESNYATIGNGEDDISGFGPQYSVMIVFKPKEMFSVTYQYTTDSNGDQKAMFYSGQVNAEMGCDMPDTIAYVDNRITWGSTQWGILCLVSTLIVDERNVQVISRNINGGKDVLGMLDEVDLKKAIAVNYEGKYMLTVNGVAYVWDYQYSPYSISSSSKTTTPDVAAKAISWFKWDNINLSAWIILNRVAYYAKDNNLCVFTLGYNDFGTAIHSYYQTPMLHFSEYQYLKTVKKAFFFIRGDTPTHISIKYITDEDSYGEEDPEDIIVNTHLWNDFSWHTWGWSIVKFAKTFARKCSIKKVNLFGILLDNNEVDRDMSLSGIRLEYSIVKEIK